VSEAVRGAMRTGLPCVFGQSVEAEACLWTLHRTVHPHRPFNLQSL
jgi:hypothetical protein